jgi:AraC-like DNA-binding protein
VLVGLCLASGTFGFLLTWGSLLQGYALVNPTTRFIELLLISLIYAVGYMGFWQPVIFQRPGSIDPEASPLSRSSATETSTPQATVANRESAAITGEQAIDKYEKSSLTPSAVEAYKEMLLEAMVGELLFLDNELNLASLAERLEMSPHHLSQVINASMGINFFEFINHYRVEYAKKCLCDPQRDGDTIINIAMAAGFNNKTSFNQAFKKSTALTPSQYRKQHLH